MVTKWVHMLKTMVRWIDNINEKTGKGVSWLNALLVLLICYDVMARYLFNVSYVAIMELEWHIFALIFLLGAGYAFKHDRHVRVDVFYSQLNKRKQAWTNLLGTVIFLIPFCIVGIITSSQFAANAFAMGEGSPDPGGLPARYVIKFAIPLGFVLLLLQGMAELAKSLLNISGNQYDDDHP